jgi:hypothetical protein
LENSYRREGDGVKETTGKSVLWVADDGSYGYGKLLMFDTASWTDEDFNRLDEASDSERVDVAVDIEYQKETGNANLGS